MTLVPFKDIYSNNVQSGSIQIFPGSTPFRVYSLTQGSGTLIINVYVLIEFIVCMFQTLFRMYSSTVSVINTNDDIVSALHKDW